MTVAGLGYLVNSYALFLAPDFQAGLFPAILLPAFVAEASLAIWFLVKGVNMQMWKLRVGRAPAPNTAGAARTAQI